MGIPRPGARQRIVNTRSGAITGAALVGLIGGTMGTTGAVAQATGVAADSIAIVAASRAFSDAYVRNDTMALGMIYSDSAVLLPPNREVTGRAAIRSVFAWRAPYRQIAHSMRSSRLTVSGSVAIDAGTWTSTGQRGEAEPSTASERYLVVWVRESDGAWRILYDMWHRPAP